MDQSGEHLVSTRNIGDSNIRSNHHARIAEGTENLAINTAIFHANLYCLLSRLLLISCLQGPAQKPMVTHCHTAPSFGTAATHGVTDTVCGKVNAVVGSGARLLCVR